MIYIKIVVRKMYVQGGTNMATWIVGGIVLTVTVLVICIMIYNRKNKKSSKCGGNCSRCGGGCH